MANEPKTLQQAIIYFADPKNCREYVVARHWPNGVTCPTCGSEKVKFSERHNRWQCSSHHAKRQFTLKTGTIFEDSPLGMDKWLCAMWMLGSCKNGVSSYEIHRAIGVTQKSAWFMLQRIRKAMQSGSLMKLGGSGKEVEADETYIGGKARNMHASRKRRMFQGKRGGTVGKVAVQGLLARHGEVRTRVVGVAKRTLLVDGILENVERGTNLYTDDTVAYYDLRGYVTPSHQSCRKIC